MIALLVSDLHFSHQKPSIRADDWYEVQTRYARQLEAMRPAWDVPIICGGDVVDRWQQPPEFINWAIDNLPEMYSVCGQHDLPNHCWDELHKSAFWTLMKFGKLKMLTEVPTCFRFYLGGKEDFVLRVYGYGWEQGTKPPLSREEGDSIIDLAVCHRYVWCIKGYEGASESSSIKTVKQEFKGYDAVLFGDNHKNWSVLSPSVGGVRFFNPGTFIRRKADEIDHKPCVGLLKADGSIERKYLDCSGDKFVDRPEQAEREGLDEFVAKLKELGDSSLDFKAAINKAFDERRTDKETRKLILEAMDG